MSGVGHIHAERLRQMDAEGWTEEHDDGHDDESLAMAASVYARPEFGRTYYMDPEDGAFKPKDWPWEDDAFKPTPDDRIRELAKAGALIAAEIDRIERDEAKWKAYHAARKRA